MPTVSITNTVYSQSLRGQNVKVTVDLTTQLAEFAQLEVGAICTNSSSGKEGLIYSIDSYGNTFEIIPLAPNMNFSNGSGGGYLQNTIIDITI